MRFYLFWLPSHCIHLPTTDAIGRVPEPNWASNNPSCHPISSEPPLFNTISRDFYNRMAKMERILSIFYHTVPPFNKVIKDSPCDKKELRCSCYWLPWKPKCQKNEKKYFNIYLLIIHLICSIRLRLYRNIHQIGQYRFNVFSAPEPKDLWGAYRMGNCPSLSVVYQLFQTTSFLN